MLTSPARVQRGLPSHSHSARRLVWSPLRASSDHSFIVGALRAQRPCQLSRHFPSKLACLSLHRVAWSILKCARRTSTIKCSFRACSPSLLEGGLFGLPLRASNEGLRRPRVARAQKTIRLHPFLCSKHLLRGVAEAALYCAHRATTVSSWGLCEQ